MTRSTRFSTSRYICLALGFASFFASGCRHTPPPAAASRAADAGVEATSVFAQQNVDYLDVPAHFMADPTRVVRIFPPLSGRIFGLRVLPGQEVKKGDVIAMLQSNDIAVARSDFEKTKIEVLRADRALTRGKLLLQHDVLSQADFYELEAVDQVAHSELERSRQHIHELGFDENGISDIISLRAPIAGAVLDIGTSTGELQRSLDNATTIATIANLDEIWVSGDFFERDLSVLKSGRSTEVLVPAYPDLKLTGTIANISDALDPATHTLKLRVVLPNPGHRLKPDMFATIRIANAARRVFILPETAVLHEGDQTYVFIAGAPGKTGAPGKADAPVKYDQRSVQLGRSLDRAGVRSIEVLAGLNDGDKVVTTGGALLRSTGGD